MCQQTDCVTTVRSSSYCSGVPFKLLLLFKKQQRILLQRTNQPTEYCLFACEAKTHQRNYCYYHRHHIELCVYLCIKYENPVCKRAEGIRKYRANDVLRIRKLSVCVAVRRFSQCLCRFESNNTTIVSPLKTIDTYHAQLFRCDNVKMDYYFIFCVVTFAISQRRLFRFYPTEKKVE